MKRLPINFPPPSNLFSQTVWYLYFTLNVEMCCWFQFSVQVSKFALLCSILYVKEPFLLEYFPVLIFQILLARISFTNVMPRYCVVPLLCQVYFCKCQHISYLKPLLFLFTKGMLVQPSQYIQTQLFPMLCLMIPVLSFLLPKECHPQGVFLVHTVFIFFPTNEKPQPTAHQKMYTGFTN